MLQNVTLLLVFQLLGEAARHVSGVPISGPVIGMALLFVWLVVRGGSAGLQETSHALLRHLSLLFVPAGAGVIAYLHLFQDSWLPIAATLIGATAATIAVTGLVMARFDRRNAKAAPASPPPLDVQLETPK
jgi:holin-like protein